MSFQFFGNINHWSWSRFKKGKFVEDESYDWSDAELGRRLGIRTRETKYFIFFREIRYKQREHNYWIEQKNEERQLKARKNIDQSIEVLEDVFMPLGERIKKKLFKI